MGCDWATGVGCFGHSIRCACVSFAQITCPNVEGPLRNTTEILLEGVNYVKDSWKLYCEHFKINIDCVFMCDETPCSHVTVYYIHKSRFVFGNQLVNGATIEQIGQLPKEDIPKHVAQFIYLFNRTGTFANVWNKNGNRRKSVKIGVNHIPSTELEDTKSKISGAEFFVGCI